MKGRVKTLIEVIIFLTGAIVVLCVVIGILAVKRELETKEINDRYIAQRIIVNDVKAEKNKIVYENAKLQEKIELLNERVRSVEKRAESAENKADILEAMESARREKEAYTLKMEVYDKQDSEIEIEVSDNGKERLPEGHTNVIYCEDYRRLNLPYSDQLKLQQVCQTNLDGFRYYTDKNGAEYYCAALAGAYGSDIGDTWRITLKCGAEFNIIYSDYQHPDQITNPDPDDFGSPATNADEQPATEVIELVADLDVMPDWLYRHGTMTALEEFGGKYGDGGDIVKIEYLGRKWVP